MTISVRRLKPDLLHGHSQAFIGIAGDVAGEYWSLDHFLLDLPDKWNLSLAVFADGDEPLGYAVASRKGQHAHLHHLAVRADRRRHGLGKRLLVALEDAARTKGFGRLTLKVADRNTDAQRFYARYGYREVAHDGGYLTLAKELK